MKRSQTHHSATRWSALAIIVVVLNLLPCAALAAGKLIVSHAWIREAPPGASMLAGYAELHNDGDQALRIVGVESDAFADASLHETVISGGISRMQSLKGIDLAPGASVAFQPGARHIMLMSPMHPIARGDKVEITFVLADGSRQSAAFKVRADASGDQ